MKNTTRYVAIFAVMALFAACKEEPPGVNYQPSATTFDTTYITPTVPTAQLKEVLLEDISGVKCVNCPDAATIAANIVQANPGRVNVINTQPDLQSLSVFCKPINDPPVVSAYDFRTKAASDILNAVAIPNSLPSGFVSRKIFSGKSDAILLREEWATAVNAELSATTPLNIELSATYDEATQEITADIAVIYTQNVSDSNFLSVSILEDSIVDAQETIENGNVIFLQNYAHKHILRDMMTNHTGDLLNKTSDMALVTGRVFKKRFTKKVVPFVTHKHFGVVAYVHQGPVKKYYVLQSKAVELH